MGSLHDSDLCYSFIHSVANGFLHLEILTENIFERILLEYTHGRNNRNIIAVNTETTVPKRKA